MYNLMKAHEIAPYSTRIKELKELGMRLLRLALRRAFDNNVLKSEKMISVLKPPITNLPLKIVLTRNTKLIWTLMRLFSL